MIYMWWSTWGTRDSCDWGYDGTQEWCDTRYVRTCPSCDGGYGLTHNRRHATLVMQDMSDMVYVWRGIQLCRCPSAIKICQKFLMIFNQLYLHHLYLNSSIPYMDFEHNFVRNPIHCPFGDWSCIFTRKCSFSGLTPSSLLKQKLGCRKSVTCHESSTDEAKNWSENGGHIHQMICAMDHRRECTIDMNNALFHQSTEGSPTMNFSWNPTKNKIKLHQMNWKW